MARLFKKKIGPIEPFFESPVDMGEEVQKRHPRLSMMEYDEHSLMEQGEISIEECVEHMPSAPMTWIHVHNADPSAVSLLGRHFQFHPLVVEDILSAGQRPKIDNYQDQVFVIARSLRYVGNGHLLKDDQISLIFGPNYLISFSEGNEDVFGSVREQLRQGGQRIRKQGSDYLAYALLDTIVDEYFALLEKVDGWLDQLEAELMHVPEPSTLRSIQRAKRDMIVLRKATWPMRDVVNRFMRLESALVHSATQLYLHDVYDHAVQIIDIIEGFRDIVSGMIDIYLSNINIRTNDIMKVLTIVSTIFVPLTFISSLYGMNFSHMPELQVDWAYPMVLALMLSIAGGMLVFFHRKKWI